MCPLDNFLDALHLAVLVYPINRKNIFIFRGFFIDMYFVLLGKAWLGFAFTTYLLKNLRDISFLIHIQLLLE